MVAERGERGRNACLSLAPVLGNSAIPVFLRRQIVMTFLLPVLSYGGELFGLRSLSVVPTLLKGLEKILREALSMISRGSWRISPKQASSQRALQMEFRIPTVSACMAGAAVRAVAKFSHSKGYISDLLVARGQAARGSWQGVVEKNVQALFKKGFGFDLSAPPGDLKTWLQSPSFQDSQQQHGR